MPLLCHKLRNVTFVTYEISTKPKTDTIRGHKPWPKFPSFGWFSTLVKKILISVQFLVDLDRILCPRASLPHSRWVFGPIPPQLKVMKSLGEEFVWFVLGNQIWLPLMVILRNLGLQQSFSNQFSLWTNESLLAYAKLVQRILTKKSTGSQALSSKYQMKPLLIPKRSLFYQILGEILEMKLVLVSFAKLQGQMSLENILIME